MSRICGLTANARARPTRCCIPPDSSLGRRFSKPSRPTSLMRCLRFVSAFIHRRAADFKPKSYVGKHVGPRHQREVLKHHRAFRSGSGNRTAVDGHFALVVGNQSSDDAQQRGLATTAWTDDGDEFIVMDFEVDVTERKDAGAVIAHAKLFAQRADPDHFTQLPNRDVRRPTGDPFFQCLHTRQQGQCFNNDGQHRGEDEIRLHAAGKFQQ